MHSPVEVEVAVVAAVVAGHRAAEKRLWSCPSAGMPPRVQRELQQLHLQQLLAALNRAAQALLPPLLMAVPPQRLQAKVQCLLQLCRIECWRLLAAHSASPPLPLPLPLVERVVGAVPLLVAGLAVHLEEPLLQTSCFTLCCESCCSRPLRRLLHRQLQD